MKLSDIFGKLGNIELVKLVRWYGYVVIGALVAFMAVLFAISVYHIIIGVFALIPWYLWVMVGIITSGAVAIHVTNEPAPEEEWGEVYLRGKIYTERDGE